MGLAWVDLSTARFSAAQLSARTLGDELARIGPTECLVTSEGQTLPLGRDERMLITPRPAWSFGLPSARETLEKHFGTATLAGFGFEDSDALALRAVMQRQFVNERRFARARRARDADNQRAA